MFSVLSGNRNNSITLYSINLDNKHAIAYVIHANICYSDGKYDFLTCENRIHIFPPLIQFASKWNHSIILNII